MGNTENEGTEKDLEKIKEKSVPETAPDKEEPEAKEEAPAAPAAPAGFIDPPKVDSVIPTDSEDSASESEEKKIKKFVIHINSDNVDYFESLTAEERSDLINDFLESKITKMSSEKRKKLIAKILRHILVILITLVIGFPVVFYLVNQSITSTIKSYKYMQVNFEKLYQEKAMKKSL